MSETFVFIFDIWKQIFQLQRNTILIYGFYLVLLSGIVYLITVIRGGD